MLTLMVFSLYLSLIYSNIAGVCPGTDYGPDPFFGDYPGQGLFPPDNTCSLLNVNQEIPYPPIDQLPAIPCYDSYRDVPPVTICGPMDSKLPVPGRKKILKPTGYPCYGDAPDDVTCICFLPYPSQNGICTSDKPAQTYPACYDPKPQYGGNSFCGQVYETNGRRGAQEAVISPSEKYGLSLSELISICTKKVLNTISSRFREFKECETLYFNRAINNIIGSVQGDQPCPISNCLPCKPSQSGDCTPLLGNAISNILDKNKNKYDLILKKNMSIFKNNVISLMVSLGEAPARRIVALLKAENGDYTFYDDLGALISELENVELENRTEAANLNKQEISKALLQNTQCSGMPIVSIPPPSTNIYRLKEQLLDVCENIRKRFDEFERDVRCDIQTGLKNCIENLGTPYRNEIKNGYGDYAFESSGYIRLYV